MRFALICEELLRAYGSVRLPAKADMLAAVEAKLSVRIPEELRAAYLVMDGADENTDPSGSWIRFWPCHEWMSAKDMLPPGSSEEDESRLYVIADYAISCVFYVMDMSARSESFGQIYALGATRIAHTAKSFSAFVQLVLEDSDDLHTYS